MEKIVIGNPFVIIFAAGTLVSFLINHVLEFVDWRARVKNGGKLPDELNGFP